MQRGQTRVHWVQATQLLLQWVPMNMEMEELDDVHAGTTAAIDRLPLVHLWHCHASFASLVALSYRTCAKQQRA